MRPLVNRTTSVDVQIREARMLTIGGFLARFTGTERHKEGAVVTVRVSDKTHEDPGERDRQHREAMRRGVDELVAELNGERRSLPTQSNA